MRDKELKVPAVAKKCKDVKFPHWHPTIPCFQCKKPLVIINAGVITEGEMVVHDDGSLCKQP